MGRPQSPLERDGTPVREFAFWLRDLRNRAGLTYEQLARITQYATSTMQDATSGQRLPTLPVLKAFVAACEGNEREWETYWAQIRRLIDAHAPLDLGRSIEPPWLSRLKADASAHGRRVGEAAEGWYLESLVALLRLDAEPIETDEQRVIVATADGLSELATSISLPRDLGDSTVGHDLEVELLHGGSLERREHPYESYFRNIIALPRPLSAGDRHEYAIRMRIPPGQPMAAHYVHVPLQRSDYFDLRVRFRRERLPQVVWKLEAVPTAVIYERNPASETLVPDRFGEVRVTFRHLRQGLTYGLSWSD